MRAIGHKVIVRIDKTIQKEKREKIGNFFIPDYLMDFKNNLQFGEVLAFGNKVKAICPQIQEGCVAIFHHAVEFKVINHSKVEEGAGIEIPDEVDEYLLDKDEFGNEIRQLTASDDVGCELFGVFIDGVIYPSKNVIFCHPNIKQSEWQMVKGIYINTLEDSESVKDSLEITTHGINENKRVLVQLIPHEENYLMRENIANEISRLKRQQKELIEKLNRVTLVELQVAYMPNTENIKNVSVGDRVWVDSKFIYFLNIMKTQYVLLREFTMIHGKTIDGVPTPVNDRVIIKRHRPSNKTNSGIIIPDTAKNKSYTGKVISVGESYDYPMDIKSGDHVIFHPKDKIEIFIDDEAYLIIHSQNVLAIINRPDFKNKKIHARLQ